MDGAYHLGEPMMEWRLSRAALILVYGVVLAAMSSIHAQAQDRRQPRIIAPEIIAPPPVDPKGLERADPRAPLGELGQPAPEPERKIQDALYHQPIAIAAGVLEAEGRTITIAGIRVISPDQVCDASSGGVWPCGKRARTALRYWLRGRAVECHARGDAGDDGVAEAADAATMLCTLAGNDVGAWLVENGWALAEPDGPYAERGEAARNADKGIFSGGPSGS